MKKKWFEIIGEINGEKDCKFTTQQRTLKKAMKHCKKQIPTLYIEKIIKHNKMPFECLFWNKNKNIVWNRK